MKKFTYKWKIGVSEFTGTYICQDETALRRHIAKYNGELLEMLKSEDVVLEVPAVSEAPKPEAQTRLANICPKCMTEYDESFKVCHKCNFMPLEHRTVSAEERYWNEFRRANVEDAGGFRLRGWMIIAALAIIAAAAIGFFGRDLLRPLEWKRYHLGWSGMSLESPRPLKKITMPADASVSPAIQDMEIYKTSGTSDFAMIFSSIMYVEGITATLEREGKAAIVEMQKSFESQGCTEFTYVATPITKANKLGVLFSGSFMHPLKIKEEFQCIVLVENSKLWFLFALYSNPQGSSIAKRVIDSIKIEIPKPKTKKTPAAKG